MDVEKLRAELEAARAELERAQGELRKLEREKQEKAMQRRLRAALAALDDETLLRLAAVAAEATADERLANRAREMARLAFTPGPTEQEVPDHKKRVELAMARSRAIASLRQRIVGALVESDPTVATLAALWGARLRK